MCDEAACRYGQWYPVLDAPLMFYLFRSKIDPTNADHVSKPPLPSNRSELKKLLTLLERVVIMLCISRSLVLGLRKLLLRYLT